MLRKVLNNRGVSARAALAFGYTPTAHILIPSERIERRIYRKEEDFIPFLFSPLFQRKVKHDSFGEVVEERKLIVGYSRTSPIYLDFSTAGGIWLFVSRTGSGKSFCFHGILDTAINNGYACIVFDVKNEYIHCDKPIQEKFLDILPPWRRPRGMPVKPLFPAYLRKKNIPKGWVFQIDIKDMKVEDMLTALGLTQDDPQAQILLTVWREESVPKSIDNLIWRVSHVNATQILQRLLPRGAKLQPFAERTQATLVRRLILLKSQRVIGSDYPFDIIGALRDGYFPVVCLDEDIGKKSYHSTYISVLVRKIYENYKRIGKRIIMAFEDAGAFCLPNRENPSCKTLILKQVIPVSARKRRIYCVGMIQNLSQIPSEALNQARSFIFFGMISGTDLEIIAKIRRKKPSIVMKKIDELNTLVKIAKAQGIIPEDFRHVIVWDDMDNAKVGFSTAPASYHMEVE